VCSMQSSSVGLVRWPAVQIPAPQRRSFCKRSESNGKSPAVPAIFCMNVSVRIFLKKPKHKPKKKELT
jgi:hypothetical protein